MAQIGASMAQLNDVPARLMVEMGAHAATDVTGFGLLGHLSEMVRQSGVTAEITADRVPVFDEVLEYVGEQMISGAIERNIDYAQQFVASTDGVDERLEYVLYDPQTSGGFLIAIEQERADELVERLREEGCEQSAIIGRVLDESDGRIVITSEGEASANVIAAEPEPSAPAAGAAEPCCADAPELPTSVRSVEQIPFTRQRYGGAGIALGGSGAAAAKEAFGAFMGAVNADGAIDLRTKELLAIALSVLAKCEPCVRIHINKAREMGISEEEINEAAWMAISFGGAPTMMFFNSIRAGDGA
jgi:AhpD family alkylhydroperoxidase